jgi:hypothetical protein
VQKSSVVALRQLDTNLNAGHSTDSCAKYNPTKIAYGRVGALAVSAVSLSFHSRKIVRASRSGGQDVRAPFLKKNFPQWHV